MSEQEISTVSASAMIQNTELMTQISSVSKMMASGNCTVPRHLQGQPSDCFAIVMQAMQWGMNPFAVAQKTHLVNGTLGYEAQLVNAVISSSRAISGRFKYEFSGNWDKPNSPDAAVRTGATLFGESDITWGEWLFIGRVTTKNSPLWKTAPKQQASYLAVKYWARLYCPEVILGVYAQDELEIITPNDQVITSQESEPEVIEFYSDEDFQEKKPAWEKYLSDKSKDANELIIKIESKGKLFTDDQKQEIRDIQIIEVAE